MGTRGSFPRGKVAGVVKLTTYLHLVLRSRMRGAIPSLSNMPSWRGAQLLRKKHRDNFTFLPKQNIIYKK
jgi:hypothetical protein